MSSNVNYVIEDLGVAAYGEAHIDWEIAIMARHPRTGLEFAVQPTFTTGFVVIDPRQRSGMHVTPRATLRLRAGRLVAQAANGGPIYQVSSPLGFPADPKGRTLLAWDWDGNASHPVAVMPRAFGVLDVAPDGRVYLANPGLARFDPATGKIEMLDEAAPAVSCGPDGFLYSVAQGKIWSVDPKTLARTEVRCADGAACPVGPIRKDGAGRLVIQHVVARKNGRVFWLELLGGQAAPVDAATVRMAQTWVSNHLAASAEMPPPALAPQPVVDWRSAPGGTTMNLPLVFADGSYISRMVEDSVTHIDAAGRVQTFRVPRQLRPMNLFTSAGGGGQVWLASILPLLWTSYDPRTGRFAEGCNPTPVVGEIYTMVWSGGRLFMASYPGGHVTRYDPSRPWRMDRSVQANPAQLGMMKNDGLAVHRPLGMTRDAAGNVYFAAQGGYGCSDSAVCRIDIDTEEMARWIYPNTTSGAVCHVSATRELILAERRDGEAGLRITLLDDATGKVAWSELLFPGPDGMVDAWVYDGGDEVYGIYDAKAEIFVFDIRRRRIVRRRPELAMGHHCWNSLWLGPDKRVWGLTRECVFAVSRDLEQVDVLARYTSPPGSGGYGVMGVAFDDAGNLYFPNDAHLMRMRIPPG